MEQFGKLPKSLMSNVSSDLRHLQSLDVVSPVYDMKVGEGKKELDD